MLKTTAIILAAGKGTRMKSERPKVLHELCGLPMVDYVIDAALAAGAADTVVVVGHGRDEVEAHFVARYGAGGRVRTALQAEQRGTGHAVMCALEHVEDASIALLLNGDGPLIEPAALRRLLDVREAGDHALAVMTCPLEDATGYGRILREGGRVVGIREHRDCSETERAIREINAGIYAASTAFLREALARVRPNNDQGELYLTDIVAIGAGEGPIADASGDPVSLGGINDRAQLALAEEVLYERIADRHRRGGVTIRRGARIAATVTIEPDATIEHGVVLRGATHVGAGAVVDVGCVLEDVEVAANARLLPYSVCARSRVGEGAHIGPFSHLRPESRVDEGAKVGNFVEIKKTHLHRGAKANHLAYLGDGEVGENANVGAGTIFCNYDGFQKHRTVIGKDAFIGSDSQLVAPVTIGEGAYVATGTTVTRDVPPDGLAIARVRQENKEGYASRLKARLKARNKEG